MFHEYIIKLQNTTKSTEKKQILIDVYNANVLDFFHGLYLCYNPFITFGVGSKMIPVKTEETQDESYSFQDFFKLTQDLSTRFITGNAARDLLNQHMNRANKDEWNLWYRQILLKDIRAGITETTINKVLKENHNKKYIIPVFGCQLANDGKDVVDQLTGDKILQSKLDGVRFLTFCDPKNDVVIHYTRNGKTINNFPHITDAFMSLLLKLPNSCWFDGELSGDTFQNIMKQINRKENVETAHITLTLFDYVDNADLNKSVNTQAQRIEKLEYFSAFLHSSPIHVLASERVNLNTEVGKKTLSAFFKKAIADGKEGIMIKNPDALYECKRSNNWLKVKPFIEESLTVVHVETGEKGKRNENRLGNLICEGIVDGKHVKTSVGSGFTDEQRDDLWQRKDELIGMVVEIRADCLTKNQDSENIWSMRFPEFKGFRGFKPGEKI